MENQKHNDNTPQATFAMANFRRNIIVFNKLEISLPNYTLETSQVKRTPWVNAAPPRTSSSTTTTTYV